MAEDMGDKTEAPTPRRRQEAREQGNIARSQDLTSAVLLLGTLMILNWFGSGVFNALRGIMERHLGPSSMSDLSSGAALAGLGRALVQAGLSLMPLFAGAMLIAVAVNIAQVGLFLNSKKLQPNLAGLNPFKGVGRLFKGGQGFAQLLIGLLKLTLVSWVAYSAVHGRMSEIVLAQGLDFMSIFTLGASIVYSIGVRIGVVLLVLALIDYGYQKFRIERELRMTKQEVKEEMRRMDGDPRIKQRRRQVAMQMLQQRIKNDVPKADVVVTNPTHIAVALKYDASSMNAPRVVAKGQGFIAQRIREVAAEAGVPILERKPLARALFKMVEVGQEIPEQFYAAIAEILAYVYELTGRTRGRAGVERAASR